MKLKNLIRIILLVAVLLLLTIVPVNAVISNNGAFDSDYYVNSYEDLKAAYANNTAASYDHFAVTGLDEWRRPSVVFDASVYLAKNPDVAATLGNSPRLAYEHFLASGMAEHRVASNEFVVDIYLANYSDVKAVYGNNMASVYNQYVYSGMAEGRIADRLIAGAEDHEHDYSVVVEYIVEPTCQEDGEAIYKCAVCGEVAPETVVVKASDEYHVYEEDEAQRVDATCIADGKKILVCTVCQDEEVNKEEVIPMSEEYHNWEAVISKGDEDYTGLEVSKCSICKEYKAVPYDCEHEYEKISTTATCTKAGVETRICNNCKDIVKVNVPATGHTVDPEEAVVTVKETCTTNGKAVGTCTECGKEAVEVVIPAAHKYEEADENTEATCTTEGLLSKICSVCGDKIFERTPAKGHTKPETGVKTYVATPTYDVETGEVTGYTKTSTEIDTTKTTLVNRTLCVSGIVEEYTCADENCPLKTENGGDGSKVQETVYEVKGHTYRTTVQPTCTTDGKKVCSVCTSATAEHEVTIPATGHKLTGYAVASTSETNVYYVNCSDCGILSASLVVNADKVTGVLTLADGTGEEWNVTIAYKDAEKTEIKSVKIGEKVEADEEEEEEEPLG